MNAVRAIRVLLKIADPQLRVRCQQALAGKAFEIIDDPATAVCDVELIDRGFGQQKEIPVSIAIGDDTLLPLDFADRELRLACKLASELTAARRSLAEARQTERRLQTEAETDPLTKLANRRAWEAACQRYVKCAVELGEPLVMTILDLDGFKSVNAEHGYAAGDRILQQVGQALAGAIRGNDFAARFGGDEFGLLLPGLPADAASEVVERIRCAAKRLDGEILVTAAAGFVGLTLNDANAEELFAKADRALRKAKAAGGNRSHGNVS